MHETHLLENIFQYLEEQEKLSCQKIKKIYVSVSEFGGIDEKHFKEQFKNESAGTRWEALEIETSRILYGPELEITRLDFE